MPPLISGVTLKVGAAAVAAAYVGSQSVLSSAWSPATRLTGSAFSADQIASGLTLYDNTTDSTRYYFSCPSNSTALGGSFWCGWINGTAATLSVERVSLSAGGMVLTSIDGAAFTSCQVSGTTYTLFTGLSDAPHFVVMKIGNSWGDGNAFLNRSAGNIMNVSGASPYIDLPNQWVRAGISDANSVHPAFVVDNTTNWTPAKTKKSAGPSNIGSAKIKGNFKNIVVSLNGQNNFAGVYVSKNGAAPIKYTPSQLAQTGGYLHQVTGLSGVATYYVWTDVAGCNVTVAGDGAHQLVDHKKQMHQFGDSITAGTGGPGEVDVLRVAASIGYSSLTAGISGYTIQQLDTALDTWLPRLANATSNDVAIVAIGRNNVGGIPAVSANYTSIINKLLSKGYGKIICRGVLPSGDGTNKYTADATAINNIVTAVGNPNVIFCDVTGCPTFSTVSNDNIHPDAAGYAVVAAYVEPLYRTILGL